MMPAVIFIGLRGLAGGMLNSLQVFGLPAFSDQFRMVIIIAVFTLGNVGIQGLAFGTRGMAFSLMMLWYALKERDSRQVTGLIGICQIKIAVLALPVLWVLD